MVSDKRRILVTGGAGFMGSAFIRNGLSLSRCERVVNLDLLTYAGDPTNVEVYAQDSRYLLIKGDVRDQPLVERICKEERIDTIVHFAAESHVDRSITGPEAFLQTNVNGTCAL